MITKIKKTIKGDYTLLQFSFNDEPLPSGFISHFPEVKCRRNFWGRVNQIEISLPHDHVNKFLQRLIKKEYATLNTHLFIDEQDDGTLARLLPPPLPETIVPGFNSEGYWQLIQSLPVNDRRKILAELKSSQVIERAKKLTDELAGNYSVCTNLNNTRLTFLAALLCVQQNKIAINQLATLHLLDSAIRTLYVAPCSYLIYKFRHENKTKILFNFSVFPADEEKNFPNVVERYLYYTIPVPNAKTQAKDLPRKMQRPLVYRFFNFTEIEWEYFCQEMENAPHSEQFVYVLNAPEFGCWSSIIFNIQKHLKCMRVLDIWVDINDEIVTETIILIPSFSMFQAAINAKAKALKRTSLHLQPTYGYLDAESYARIKSTGCIPVAMYLPERKPALQYNSEEGGFRSTVDGHPSETAFAGTIHDVYHAFRELCMSENVANARIRLAEIAKSHPKNRISADHRPIDETLIDGELIFNYPPNKDTIFCKNHRSQGKEIFGDLFYTAAVRKNLDTDLKWAFIYDMVSNKKDWWDSFQIKKTDLRPCDQRIYDKIEASLKDECSLPNKSFN